MKNYTLYDEDWNEIYDFGTSIDFETAKEKSSVVLKNKGLCEGTLEITEALSGDILDSVSIFANNSFSLRTKAEPKKTIKVYKLVRYENGKIYPLFIDKASELEFGVWYDADSPNYKFLSTLPLGNYLIKDDKVLENQEKAPTKTQINEATQNGARWIKVDVSKVSNRYGEFRSYYNYGINGADGVSTYALRGGWHSGSLPVMNQIGKGKDKNLRDDSFVWTECEISADKDYTAEAQKNPTKDLPTKIPTDGFYKMCTNADKKKAQADKMDWYVSGEIKFNRLLSDKETHEIIDKFNKENNSNVKYDFPRESGFVFDGKKLVEKDNNFSLGSSCFGILMF